MANYRFGVDCESEEIAKSVGAFIGGIDIYQDDLEISEERVSLCSKTPLLQEVERFSKQHGVSLSIEVWPEDLDFDEAEEAGSLETYSYP